MNKNIIWKNESENKSLQIRRVVLNAIERMGQASEAFHFNNFELIDGELYYKSKSRPLMIRGRKLRLVGTIADILGKEALRD